MRPGDHRWLIVDDSPEFCAAVQRMLETAQMEVAGSASTLADAIAQAQALRPTIALVDVDLGGESGFDVVSTLSDEVSPAPMLILTSTHPVDDFVDMVESSAALAFVPKFGLTARLLLDILAQVD